MTPRAVRSARPSRAREILLCVLAVLLSLVLAGLDDQISAVNHAQETHIRNADTAADLNEQELARWRDEQSVHLREFTRVSQSSALLAQTAELQVRDLSLQVTGLGMLVDHYESRHSNTLSARERRQALAQIVIQLRRIREQSAALRRLVRENSRLLEGIQ